MFEHYLSYGSTDQQTVRDLAPFFDGLVVPGTIAAFQSEGTKGFVLSLSARSSDPYMIDSRFPLFQNQLLSPKKSHVMLADLLDCSELIRSDRMPVPSDFSDSIIERASKSWIDFNIGFDKVKTKTFDKYAARLNEAVLPTNTKTPSAILPPYTMVSHRDDGWADVSERLWESSVDYARSINLKIPLKRVVAATSAPLWAELDTKLAASDIIAWISNLDEFRPSSGTELEAYGHSIFEASQQGKSVFALYGGFFSVLLARLGLTGSSHGIGYGEHRDFVELPTSGAPPARYYSSRLHRYIPVDVAQILWTQFPQLVDCSCGDCFGRAPAALDYHDLMRHSVRARHQEIQEWEARSTADAIAELRTDQIAFLDAASRLQAPGNVNKRVEEASRHLKMWADVLQALMDSGIA